MVDFEQFDHNEFDEGTPQSFDPVPPGDYVCAVKRWSREQRNGKSQIDFVVAAVLDKDGEAIGGGWYGDIWEIITLTEAAAWRLAKLLGAIGATPPINVTSDRSLAQAVRWKPFKARIKHRTYQEKLRAQIDSYLPLSEKERAAFNAIADDLAADHSVPSSRGTRDDYDDDVSSPRRSRGGNGQARASKQYDDDIPF